MRVGLIGAGMIGKVHLDAWQRLGAEVTISTLPEDNPAEIAARHGVAAAPSVEEAIDDADLVDVCTPTDVHAEIVHQAIAARRPVVCEKPIARDLASGRAMLVAAREADVPLYVAHVVRFFPEYAAGRRAVEAGRVGAPGMLRLARVGAAPGWSRWLHQEERSGGVIFDLMVHDLDYARWVAGEVVRVYAKQTGPPGPEDNPTHAYAVLTHASGAISHVTGSWALPSGFRTSFEIAGSAGLLEYATDAKAPLRFEPSDLATDGGGLPPALLDEPPFQTELREFAAAAQGGPKPRVTGYDGLAALAVAEAAADSVRTGAAVVPQDVSDLAELEHAGPVAAGPATGAAPIRPAGEEESA